MKKYESTLKMKNTNTIQLIRLLALLIVLTPANGFCKDTCVVLVGNKLNSRSSNSVKSILENKVGDCYVYSLDYLKELPTADLSSVKFMYFPGGKYFSIKPSAEAVENIRKAVVRGMGYFGTCGGSLIAVESTPHSSVRNQLSLFPGHQPFGGGTGMRRYNFNVAHPVVANSSVADSITPDFDIHYNGGGSDFQPTVYGLVNWVVAKDQQRQTPAMTTTLFGRGRVFLTVAHPERSWIPATHPVVVLAAEWCLGRSDPEKNQPPIVKTCIPIKGSRVNKQLTFSAVRSDDPEGYPIGFIWNFGDGSDPAYRPLEKHKYTNIGVYTITLTVTDGRNEVTRTKEITISANEQTTPPKAAADNKDSKKTNASMNQKSRKTPITND